MIYKVNFQFLSKSLFLSCAAYLSSMQTNTKHIEKQDLTSFRYDCISNNCYGWNNGTSQSKTQTCESNEPNSTLTRPKVY